MEVSTLHKQFLEMRRMRDMGVLSLSEWDNWLSGFSARFDELLKMSDEIVAEQAHRKAEFEAGEQQKAAFSRTNRQWIPGNVRLKSIRSCRVHRV